MISRGVDRDNMSFIIIDYELRHLVDFFVPAHGVVIVYEDGYYEGFSGPGLFGDRMEFNGFIN